MTPDEFVAAVALRARSSRIDVASRDPRLETVPNPFPGRGSRRREFHRFSMEGGPMDALRPDVAVDALDAEGVADAARMVGIWEKERLWQESMLDADRFVHGAGGDRPYLVDAVADRLLAAKGISWAGFATVMGDVHSEPRRGRGRDARTSHQAVWTRAFRTYAAVPREFSRGYYRSAVPLRDTALGALGETHGVAAAGGGRNLKLDFVIAPGVAWLSSAAPMVAILDRLPDVAMQGMKGRHATELVGSDLLDVPGLTIRHVRWTGYMTTATVEDVRVDVADRARTALRRAA